MTEQEHVSERNPEQVSADEEQRPGGTAQPDAEQENRATKNPRPDTTVRSVQPEARVQMERGDDTFSETGFAKGESHPTAHQTRVAYDTEGDRDMLRESQEPIFPDSPGGTVGAAPISEKRGVFLEQMMQIGHFESRDEAQVWTRAVFDALRERANDVDNLRETIFDDVARVGESPEVQVETMMWGEGFPERHVWLVNRLQGWSKEEFCREIAGYANTTSDDPWVEAALYSFFGALKQVLGDKADGAVRDLGEMQQIWEQV